MDIFDQALSYLFHQLSAVIQEGKKNNRINDDFHNVMSVIDIDDSYAVGIRFKGSVYCIIVHLINEHQTSAISDEDFSKYLEISYANNFIPILFPVKAIGSDPYTFENGLEGNNYLCLITGKRVNIYTDSVRDMVPRSHYEYLDAARNCLQAEYGQTTFVKSISSLNFHSDPYAIAWFHNNKGQRIWVSIRYHFKGENHEDLRHIFIRPKAIQKLSVSPGYLADIEFEERVPRVYDAKAKVVGIKKFYSPTLK
ncbi:hypothetical protein [Kaistella pullorum]|uniref:Uncharacterized protein n=1 Tax=Kaistella pullorum TaxID=2763074 RepID=A0ABR8WMD0_9FLAO|nr:hypothetical protein [Kaistella pullorum]MBD8018135.1 hypothetical protein [Kaistella pullorum]